MCFLNGSTNPSVRYRTGISQQESNPNYQERQFTLVSFKEPGDVEQASRSLMGDLKLSFELLPCYWAKECENLVDAASSALSCGVSSCINDVLAIRASYSD